MLYFSIPHENEHRLYFLTQLTKTFIGGKKCTVTVMTDDHEVVNRCRSVNSISRSLDIQLVYNMYACNLVQWSTVLADTDIRLLVETQPVSVRKQEYKTPVVTSNVN